MSLTDTAIRAPNRLKATETLDAKGCTCSSRRAAQSWRLKYHFRARKAVPSALSRNLLKEAGKRRKRQKAIENGIGRPLNESWTSSLQNTFELVAGMD
ncbi:MAG: hypothetical protein ACLR0N_13530 [Bilophila wadsworthia]